LINDKKKIALWHHDLASVISKGFNHEAIAELLKAIEHLTQSSSGMITIFPDTLKPQTTHHRLLANENPRDYIQLYDSGAYLLDPIYKAAINKQTEGPITLKSMIPEGFEQSEYFNVFYNKFDFIDEVCLLFRFPSEKVISISIVRHAGELSFNDSDIELLEAVFPLIKVILAKWDNNTQPKDTSLEYKLDNALTHFGTSLLTPKECQILHLVLHGCSVKYIANKLQNSIETIKHHRKSIYTKLDINSQSELFYMFIASLKAMPEKASGDPLFYLLN